MTTLLIALLYIAPQPGIAPQLGLDCGPVASRPGQFVPLGLNDSPSALARPRLAASRQFSRAPDLAEGPAAQGAAIDAELLFYLDSHVQAVSDTGPASLNPWVQLHPVGALGGAPDIEAPAVNSGERSDGNFGNGRLSGAGHACS